MVQITEDDPFGENEFVVTKEDVDSFKQQILEEMAANTQLYHPKDVEMIKDNYEICRRYVRHKRRDIDGAVEMAKKSLQWRNEFGVNGLSEANIYRLYFNVGCFIPFKKDKLGSQCIIFRTKLHRKNAERSHDMKKYLIFWVEKLLYELNNPRMTFVFASTDASYSSMDLEQIMFTIQIFNEYYPWALGYVIVYNMPWILKTVWTGIQALIPAEGTDRFKFCNGEEIFNYIERDNLPTFMGGSVPTPFRELTSEEIEAVPVDPNIEKRIRTTPAIREFYLVNFGLFANSTEHGNSADHSKIFACKPEGCLSFETSENGARNAYLELTNCSLDNRTIAYRIRTNRPDGHIAHPHCGTIQHGATVRIQVTKLKDSDRKARDKLLVQVAPVDSSRTATEVAELFKQLNRNQLFEKKILCERFIGEDENELDLVDSPSESIHESLARKINSIERKVTALQDKQQIINIVLFAIVILQMAIALHGNLCNSEDSWWFC